MYRINNNIYLEALNFDMNYKIDLLRRFNAGNSQFNDSYAKMGFLFYKIERGIPLEYNEKRILELNFGIVEDYSIKNIIKCVSNTYDLLENTTYMQGLIMRDNVKLILYIFKEKVYDIFRGISKWFKKKDIDVE